MTTARTLPSELRAAFRRIAAPNRSLCVVLFLSLALYWPFGGGGRKVQMMAGTVNPAARATIFIRHSQNGNESLDIKAQSLAAPSSLTPPENAYVLWIQPPGQDPQNQGELRTGQHEGAELHTETAFKRFKIFITAEQNAQAQTPQGPSILSAEVAQQSQQ